MAPALSHRWRALPSRSIRRCRRLRRRWPGAYSIKGWATPSISTFSPRGASPAPRCCFSCGAQETPCRAERRSDRMHAVKEGDLLWTPGAARISQAYLTHYMGWLAERGRRFDSYAALWQWSIDDLDGFWGSLWEYFDIRASQSYERVLGQRSMPGAEWFPGARLNYAEHALRNERDGADALLYLSERRTLSALSWTDLGSRVRKLATQ